MKTIDDMVDVATTLPGYVLRVGFLDLQVTADYFAEMFSPSSALTYSEKTHMSVVREGVTITAVFSPDQLVEYGLEAIAERLVNSQ